MKKTIAFTLAVLLLLAMITGCSTSNSSIANANETPINTDESLEDVTTTLSKEDIPALPVLSYTKASDNEWELKRLRLSRQGFDVLDERGRVLLQESGFSLSDASDSFRIGVESRADYLEKTFWFGLRGLLDTGAVGTTLGFLEYYGFYYLVSDYGSDDGIVLIPMSTT